MKHPLATVILVSLAGCVVGTPTPPLDPCHPSVYRELNETYRSTGFETTYPSVPKCDMYLHPSWYRFTGQADGTMPTTCQDRFKCGTIVPLWMKGIHPSVTEGIVNRQACGDFLSRATGEDPCCDLSIDIQVKNCGHYYVYYLRPVPGCPASYCSGNVAPCPVGKWSEDNFPPCRNAYPFLTVSPQLLGPKISSNRFEFQCKITFDTSDPQQVFEVIWTADGVQIIDPELITDPVQIAVLDGADLYSHMNSKIDCRVRSYYRGNQEVKSDYLISNSYYVGITVSPATLLVSEKDISRNLTITSTIPVICDHGFNCCIEFILDIDAEDNVFIPKSCNYKLCGNDWDQQRKIAVVNVPVVAKQDLKENKDKHLLITFEKLTPTGGGTYMDIFYGHRPDQVQVIVKDEKTSYCKIYNDPWVLSFDRSYYNMSLLGDFTVYEVSDRHFQIQIRTWICKYGVCVCGVAIREKNDIILIDQCNQMHANDTVSPIVKIGNSPLREGVVIQRSTDGSEVEVYLLSGAFIKVHSLITHLQLYIHGPGFDKNKARGICGTFDGDSNNEYTYPNGTVDESDSHVNFFEAWRVGLTDSLFEVIPENVLVNDVFRYCTCNNQTSTVSCRNNILAARFAQFLFVPHDGPTEYRAEVDMTLAGRFPQVDPAKFVMNMASTGGWGREKREAVYGDFDRADNAYYNYMATVDLQHSFAHQYEKKPISITKDEARHMCSKALEKSPLYSKCGQGDNNMASGFIERCVDDILVSGTTDFLDSVTSVFTTSCQLELVKDPANYVTSPTGKQIMKPEYLDDICDHKCDEHGRCGQKGVCMCDLGWEGHNCHIQSGIGPQLKSIRSGPLCSLSKRPCETVFIDASNINLSDDLICRVQAVNDDGRNTGRPVDTEAKFISAFRISCALPATAVSSQLYNVSASNDGSLFGNQLSVRVFDSSCLDCTANGCTGKATACHISNKCYRNGAKHKDDPSKVCDVSKDISDWTYKGTSVQKQDFETFDLETAVSRVNSPTFFSASDLVMNHFTPSPERLREAVRVF